MFIPLTQSGVRRLSGESTTKRDLIVFVGGYLNQQSRDMNDPTVAKIPFSYQ